MTFVYSAEVEKALGTEESARNQRPQQPSRSTHWQQEVHIPHIQQIYDDMMSMGQALGGGTEIQETDSGKTHKRVSESRLGRAVKS